MPTLLVTFHIDHKVDAFVQPVADDVPDKELERLECFSFSSDEQACIVAFDFEDWSVEVFVVQLFERQDNVRVDEIN